MIVGIQNPLWRKKDPITDVYRKILNANGIKYVDLNINQPSFWDDVRRVDVFIYRWANNDYYQQIAHTIIPILEVEYGKSCFPNYSTCWHYDDKVKQSLLLHSNYFPACEFYVFWNKREALEWLDTANLPLVFKLKSGSGSMNVKLLTDRNKAKKMVKIMFDRGIDPYAYGFFNALKTYNYKGNELFRYYAIRFRNKYLRKENHFWAKQRNYVYFQKYMPENQYDTRVQITGERAFAFVRYNRPNDFRASGSNNWSLDHKKIDMEFVKIAFDISKKFGFQSMAYDFIYDEKHNPVIVEISYCFGDYPEFSTGFWDTNLNWHAGRFLPQYFELVDLINSPELKLPKDVMAASNYTKIKVT